MSEGKVAQGGDEHGRGLPEDAALLERNLTLRDGCVVRVRPIRADDTERLQTFHAHLSAESIVFRFFRTVPRLSLDQATQFTHVDYVNRMALVATRGEGETDELLAVVRYDRTGEREAEVAFVVQDAWQGHGLATDAPKFKDFILPLVFCKRLSDVFDDEMAELAKTFGDVETARGVIDADHTDALFQGRRPIVRFYIPAEYGWRELRNRPADGSLGEFVIVHELVHLLAPNHGRVFKNFMHVYLPDWQQREKALRRFAPANQTR